ncbi:MAG: hypothetical protein C4K49_06255 [Candidatus Thorarchaeota archaeon]|nr:MAG: hypothetical protein C4K49_06255 [Candidatus Thorarchaeota archaeon]
MTALATIEPVLSNVPEFAYEFVKRLRNSPETKTKPSIRQTQAIPQLLSSRYLRQGRLTLDDFIDAAVCTTFPPDQELARLIAEDMVLGRTREERKEEPQSELQESPARADKIQAVIQQIRWEQDLAKRIRKDRVQAGYDYLQQVRSAEDSSLYNAAHDYLSDGDIVLRGISSDEELRSNAAAELLDRAGNLTSRDIANSAVLKVLGNLCKTQNAAEKLAAKALNKSRDVMADFTQLATRDPSTAARALRHVEQLQALSKAKRKAMDEVLQETLGNLSQASSYSSELGRTPDILSHLIKTAATTYRLDDSFEFAGSIRKHTGKDVTEEVLQEYDSQYDAGASGNVDIKQLAGCAMDSLSWKNLVDKLTKAAIESAESRSSPAEFLVQKLKEAESHRQKMPDRSTAEKWDDMEQHLADAAACQAQSGAHLRQTVRSCANVGKRPSIEAIKQAGERLDMTEEEILELLNPSFEVIKKLIQQGVSSFERLHELMASAGLTTAQLRQLGDIAYERSNEAALGAVAHVNLLAALGLLSDRRGSYGAVRNSGGAYGDKDRAIPPKSERTDRVMAGLLGGPATDVVRIWYTYRDEIPDDVKEQLRRIAKKLLVDLGMRFSREIMGSSMLGGLMETPTVRPFRIGDEVDLIDLEETIESLLSQGRTDFQMLNPDDFLATETYMGHRAFFWALDKSGSMDAPEKLGMLAVSVMAGLFAVQRDDFGVVLFDSETCVVKRIQDRGVSVEKVAGDLLDVRAGGGTGARQSLSLALEDFTQTRAKEKILILSTDMYLSDLAACEELAGQIRQQEIRTIIIVPSTSHNADSADALARAAHGVVLNIASIEELPQSLLRVTNY